MSRAAGAVRNVTVATYAAGPAGIAVRAVGASPAGAAIVACPYATAAAAPATPPAVSRPTPVGNPRRSGCQVTRPPHLQLGGTGILAPAHAGFQGPRSHGIEQSRLPGFSPGLGGEDGETGLSALTVLLDVLDRTGAGLHDIWGMTSTTTDAALSLLILAGWAMLITAAAIRVFTRSAVT